MEASCSPVSVFVVSDHPRSKLFVFEFQACAASAEPGRGAGNVTATVDVDAVVLHGGCEHQTALGRLTG